MRDPWNYWAFSARVSTFLNGEQSYTSSNVHGSLNANRVAAGLKVQANACSSKNRSEFKIDDTTSFVSEQRNYGTSLLVAPTIGGHWGWAVYGEASRSTYQNQAQHLEFRTGLAYDIWPYEQVSHRMLTLRLTTGIKHFRYDEMTLYGETSETRPVAELETSLSATQKWGSVGVSVDGSTYLHDLEKHKLELSGNLDVRLVRGLSLSLWGQVASIHDQLFLPAGGATDAEILLRRRQLATNYSYYTSVGLSYSFGSRFNNVVNPRFR